MALQKLNLYYVWQDKNNGYDTHDSFVIACKSEEIARNTHPYGGTLEENKHCSSWVRDPKDVVVEFIGKADKKIIEQTMICVSFNAG